MNTSSPVRASILAVLLAGGVSFAQPAAKTEPPKSETPAQPKAESPASKPTEAATPKEAPPKSVEAPKSPDKVDPYVLGFVMKDIDGKDVKLETFKGKVVLIVNTASKCGYTPQYEGLEKLYESKKDAGLVILGFPSNDFGKQEPGSDSEIKQFCTATYKVTFPMFSKIVVKGKDAHPLYAKLAKQPPLVGGDPKWNFTKFLVDRSGNVVARFDSGIKPDDSAMTKKIDELLAAK